MAAAFDALPALTEFRCIFHGLAADLEPWGPTCATCPSIFRSRAHLAPPKHVDFSRAAARIPENEGVAAASLCFRLWRGIHRAFVAADASCFAATCVRRRHLHPPVLRALARSGAFPALSGLRLQHDGAPLATSRTGPTGRRDRTINDCALVPFSRHRLISERRMAILHTVLSSQFRHRGWHPRSELEDRPKQQLQIRGSRRKNLQSPQNPSNCLSHVLR